MNSQMHFDWNEIENIDTDALEEEIYGQGALGG